MSKFSEWLAEFGGGLNSIIIGFGQTVQSGANFNNSQADVARSNAAAQTAILQQQKEQNDNNTKIAIWAISGVILVILGFIILRRKGG